MIPFHSLSVADEGKEEARFSWSIITGSVKRIGGPTGIECGTEATTGPDGRRGRREEIEYRTAEENVDVAGTAAVDNEEGFEGGKTSVAGSGIGAAEEEEEERRF